MQDFLRLRRLKQPPAAKLGRPRESPSKASVRRQVLSYDGGLYTFYKRKKEGDDHKHIEVCRGGFLRSKEAASPPSRS